MLESLYELSFLHWLLFAFAGIVAGIVNTLAGSGSLLTLPIFMFVCGLPANLANGTNRVGVVIQSAVGLRGFQRTGSVDYHRSSWIVVPAVCGAILGAWLASEMTEQQMSNFIGGLMAVMIIVLSVNPKRWIVESNSEARNNTTLVSIATYFAIGMYGGFIQAGVGILLLAANVLVSKYSLKEGNGIKLLVVFAFAIPSLIVFALNSQIHFGFGIAMALFQSIGALMGVRFATSVPDANVWIHRLLLLVLFAATAKIFLFR